MIANQDNAATPVVAKRKGRKQTQAGEIMPAQAMRAGKKLKLGEANENKPLTRKQMDVLDVIMDPANWDKTREELAELAGCSKVTLWQTLKHPGVEQQRQQLCKHLIVTRVAPAMDAMAKTAAMPGRDGFQDRRLLFSMTGDYVERQQHDVNVTARVLVGVVGVSTDDL